MFTSEPSLVQRIERMIGDIPVIDAYCRVSAKRPGVLSLAELLADPHVRVELRGVGMPASALDADVLADGWAANAIPYLRRMRNTATAWCFFRILRDLYDFADPDIDERNLARLETRIAECGADPNWANSVMFERAKLRAIATSRWDEGSQAVHLSEKILEMRDLTAMMSPLPVVKDDGGNSIADYYERLSTELGGRPGDINGLQKLIFERLDRSLTTSVKFSHFSMPADFTFATLDESETSALLSQGSRGKGLNHAEMSMLASVVGRLILAWHHERGQTVQVALSGSPAAASWRWRNQWINLLRDYHNARFAFLVAPEGIGWDAALLAREFPNAYVAASWREFPVMELIERDIATIIQTVPMTKVFGFSSGAGSVESVYGRLQLVKKATAGALAGLVERRCYEEDEVPAILEQILLKTPRQLCGLES